MALNLKFFVSLILIFLLLLSFVIMVLNWLATNKLTPYVFSTGNKVIVDYTAIAVGTSYEIETKGSDVAKHVNDIKLYKILPAVFNVMGIMAGVYLLYLN